MDHLYWIALKGIPHVGNVTFRRLLERFENPRHVFNAGKEELTTVKGITMEIAASIVACDFAGAERECSAVARAGARIVTFYDQEYPPLLKEVADAPPFLYVRGHLPFIDQGLGVVGSRRASHYGLMTTERLSIDLVQHGITVVSGMARGVDTAAHRGALKGNGTTVAVLGSGIDVLYPPENARLFAQVMESGAVVSEFPMGTAPLAVNFPCRNRIISGCCIGVLVVEAAEKSGSLITAEYALEQGREVFAVPGNITLANSKGTNRLIKQGAKLVESVDDILDELLPLRRHHSSIAQSRSVGLPPEEHIVCALLADGPLHIDEIIGKSALTVGDVSARLLRLELKGVVRQLPGKYFAIEAPVHLFDPFA
jgi:DNA processing protein